MRSPMPACASELAFCFSFPHHLKTRLVAFWKDVMHGQSELLLTRAVSDCRC